MRRTRTLWSTPWAVLALIGFGLVVGLTGPGQVAGVRALARDARAFSAQEQKDLAAGKLVVRPEERRQGGGHYIGGLSWQVVNADVARVWAVLSDVPSYPRFLPAVAEAKRVARLGRAERVFIRHQVSIVEASYCVLVTPEPAHNRLIFKLDHSRPSAISDAFGELRVTTMGPGRSVISFAIMVDVGEGLIAGLLRGQVHEWMLRVPEQLERFIAKQMRQQKSVKPLPAGPGALSKRF